MKLFHWEVGSLMSDAGSRETGDLHVRFYNLMCMETVNHITANAVIVE